MSLFTPFNIISNFYHQKHDINTNNKLITMNYDNIEINNVINKLIDNNERTFEIINYICNSKYLCICGGFVAGMIDVLQGNDINKWKNTDIDIYIYINFAQDNLDTSNTYKKYINAVDIIDINKEIKGLINLIDENEYDIYVTKKIINCIPKDNNKNKQIQLIKCVHDKSFEILEVFDMQHVAVMLKYNKIYHLHKYDAINKINVNDPALYITIRKYAALTRIIKYYNRGYLTFIVNDELLLLDVLICNNNKIYISRIHQGINMKTKLDIFNKICNDWKNKNMDEINNLKNIYYTIELNIDNFKKHKMYNYCTENNKYNKNDILLNLDCYTCTRSGDRSQSCYYNRCTCIFCGINMPFSSASLYVRHMMNNNNNVNINNLFANLYNDARYINYNTFFKNNKIYSFTGIYAKIFAELYTNYKMNNKYLIQIYNKSRSFCVFDSIDLIEQFINYQKTNSISSYYEIINSDKPCKPYLDIEWLDVKYNYDPIVIMTKLINDIIIIYKNAFNVILNKNDILLLESHKLTCRFIEKNENIYDDTNIDVENDLYNYNKTDIKRYYVKNTTLSILKHITHDINYWRIEDFLNSENTKRWDLLNEYYVQRYDIQCLYLNKNYKVNKNGIEKYSYHIIINDGNMFSTNKKQIDKITAYTLYKLLIEYDENYKNIIDGRVYTKDREFRMIYSSKKPDKRTFIPIDNETFKRINNPNVLDYLITYPNPNKTINILQ